MKKIKLLVIILLISFSAISQKYRIPDFVFLANKKSADSFANLKDYRHALIYHLKNVKSKYMMSDDLYRIARYSYITNMYDNKFIEKYIKKALKKGRIYFYLRELDYDTLLKSNLDFINKYKVIIKAQTVDSIKVKYPNILKDLMERKEKDQLRSNISLKYKDTLDDKEQKEIDSLWVIQNNIDSNNVLWLYKIVKKIGWLGINEVGYVGSNAAWLLAQHADYYNKIQNYFLKKIIHATIQGNVNPKNTAYLIDRVSLYKDTTQIFGTQMDVKIEKDTVLMKPKKLWNEYYLNTLRSYYNLPTIEYYIKYFTQQIMKKN